MLSTMRGTWFSPQGIPIPRITCAARSTVIEGRDLVLIKLTSSAGLSGLLIKPMVDITFIERSHAIAISAQQRTLMYEGDRLLIPKGTTHPTQYIEIEVCNVAKETN